MPTVAEFANSATTRLSASPFFTITFELIIKRRPRHVRARKEARFSERKYGRFGSYFEYTIEKDKPLVVKYRLWLQDGLMKPADVAALSNNFLDTVRVDMRFTDRSLR